MEWLKQIKATIDAVKDLNIQIVWLWPNVDAGSDDISKGLRILGRKQEKKIKFYKILIQKII